jgi:hypothetical protein
VACPSGNFVRVELKVVTRGRKINLSPHQYSFHLKHAAMKCRTFILVEHWSTTAPKQLLLYTGAQAKDIFDKGVLCPPVGSWPLAAVDWNDVEKILDGIFKDGLT